MENRLTSEETIGAGVRPKLSVLCHQVFSQETSRAQSSKVKIRDIRCIISECFRRVVCLALVVAMQAIVFWVLQVLHLRWTPHIWQCHGIVWVHGDGLNITTRGFGRCQAVFECECDEDTRRRLILYQTCFPFLFFFVFTFEFLDPSLPVDYRGVG